MFSALQPSRPKPPQHPPNPTYAHQQRRAIHETSQTSSPVPSQQHTAPSAVPLRPRSQIEAMPPFGPAQTPATFFTPLYDSAVRHPVFFTQNLKKPPFPIPQGPSQSCNPVASGYVVEQRRGPVMGQTKL